MSSSTAVLDNISTPPTDPTFDAEANILGACMIDNRVIANVQRFVKPANFDDTRHKIIFEAIIRMHANAEPVDLVTLSTYLTASGKLVEAGGQTHLSALFNCVISTKQTSAYAQIVADASKKRLVDQLGFLLVSTTDPRERARIAAEIATLSLPTSRGVFDFEAGNVGRFLDAPPPPRQWLFDGIITKGTVGGLFGTGGAGKSFLRMHLAVSAVTGMAWGPFRPIRPTRVMILEGEDDEKIVWERVWSVAVAMFGTTDNDGQNYLPPDVMARIRHNLNIQCLAGVADKHLVAFDDRGNPSKTSVFHDLDLMLSANPRDLLIIDTLSRFYGLNENDNRDGSYWVACLEELSRNHHGMTVWYAHHENKMQATSGTIETSRGRGATSIFDNSRFALAIAPIDEATATDLDLDPACHVMVANTKNSYAPKAETIYIRRRPDGTMAPVVIVGRTDRQVEALVDAIKAHGEPTLREIERGIGTGKAVSKAMKSAFPKMAVRRETSTVVNRGIEIGLVKLERRDDGRNIRAVVTVTPTADKVTADNGGQNTLSALKSATAAERDGGQSYGGQTACPPSFCPPSNRHEEQLSAQKNHGGQSLLPKGRTGGLSAVLPLVALGSEWSDRVDQTKNVTTQN